MEDIDRNLFPQSISVNDLTIYPANKQPQNIKSLLVDLSYFEDIYSFAISGYVKLRDATGIIEKLNLSGNETISLSFDTSSTGTRKKQFFKLYTIPSRQPIGPMNSEFIKLYFCSEELLLSEQIKVTKAYSTEISNIVRNILSEKLRVQKPMFIDSTTGTYNFNIPTLKPFEAISWLSIYARPTYNNLIGADMLFYENKDGFYFKSLSNLYQQQIYRTYKYQQQNVSKSTLPESSITVLDFEFVKAFNSLEDIEAGTFANRLITLDPLTRKVNVKDFKYSDYGGKKLNEGTVLEETQNRLGKTQSEAVTGKIKLAISNSDQRKKSWAQNAQNNSVAPDIFVETFIPNRTAQMALANYTLVKIKIPCDPGLKVGDVINFQLPSISSKELDMTYSGRYLVTAIRHIIRSEGGSESVLEIAKDSETNRIVANNPLG